MIVQLKDLTQLTFLIPTEKSTWVSRLEAACTFLEMHPSLPRAPLRQSILKSGKTRDITNRVKYFADSLRDMEMYVAISNGRERRYTRQGEIVDEGMVVLHRDNDMLPHAVGFVVNAPLISQDARKEVLAGVGDALHAYSGYTMPDKSWRLLHERAGVPIRMAARQSETATMSEFNAVLAKVNVNLPVVQTNYGVFTSPFQPEVLGWMNYWSKESCDYIGFPNPQRDADLLANAQRTPIGAWEVMITQEPLDLMRADHLRYFAELHERFPKLGVTEQRKWDRP